MSRLLRTGQEGFMSAAADMNFKPAELRICRVRDPAPDVDRMSAVLIISVSCEYGNSVGSNPSVMGGVDEKVELGSIGC